MTMVSASTLAKMAALHGLSASNVIPMNNAQLKDASRIEETRQHQSREASKNASGKQDGKYLRRARDVLNDRRNFHAKHPNSSGGHACKAPGSMKG